MSQADTQTTYEYSLQPSEIPISRSLVERSLGYRKGTAPAVVSSLVDEILPDISEYLHIKCGFTILPAEMVRVSGDSIFCNDVTFSTGPIIAKRLRTSYTFALFAATVGPRLEQWSRELMAGPETMKGYIVDAIASGAVEKVADRLEARVEDIVRPLGWNITNRYSPGHCDWSVAEQHKLFSFLPERFCGISLTPTALMVPVKSVSGVIGVGAHVTREEHQCSICDMKDCFRRQVDGDDE